MPHTFLTWSLLALVATSVLACTNSGSTADPQGGRVARIETPKGTIRFRLYEKETPITTGNFIGLADRGFYNGLTFHRVEPGFVVQGGDPAGNGTGGSGKTIPLEIVKELKHDGPGVVAMARSADPNSASCQFYITLASAPHLDGGYAVFGKVIEGIDVVSKLQVGDKMTKVSIEPAAGQGEPVGAGAKAGGSDAPKAGGSDTSKASGSDAVK